MRLKKMSYIENWPFNKGYIVLNLNELRPNILNIIIASVRRTYNEVDTIVTREILI